MAACPRCGYGNDNAAGFCGNPDCRADLRPDPAARDRPDGRTGASTDARAGGRTADARTTDARTTDARTTDARRTDGRTTDGRGPATRGRAAEIDPRPPVVGWLTPGARPPAGGGGEQSAAPEQSQRRGVAVTMEPVELTVDPGGTTATTITVRNRGTRVEQFRLGVNGPAAPFAQVQPQLLSVFPDDEQTAVVTFAPPRASSPQAGRAPFQVVARSDVHSDVADRVAGAVTVGRFDQLRATLEPEMTRGRRPGRHRVNLVNAGNAPLVANVALTDREGELEYDPPAFAVPVAPGATEVGEVLVGAAARWFGRVQSLPFTATVSTGPMGQPILLNGTRRQVPRLPWWVPTAALALVALLITLYAVWPGAKVPEVGGLERAAAVSALEDAGYRAVEIGLPDEDIPQDLAIRTEPAGGAQLDAGERVRLFLSAGPCRGQCPVAVPNVDGLTVAEAEQDLTAAQFVVERVNEVEDQRPAGTVMSTSPAAGTEAEIGSSIVITASSGPPGGPASAGAEPSAGEATEPGQPPGQPGGGGGGGGGGAPVVLPELVGLSADDAEAQLADLGLTVERTRTRSNAAELDAVLSTEPAAGSSVAENSSVRLTLAEPTAPVDMLSAADAASWSSGAGALPFPGADTDARGFALIRPPATALEDGSTAEVLETHPQWVPGGSITGEFDVESVIKGDHLRAEVGFLPGGVGDVEFVVTARGRELARVRDTAANGELVPIDADLSSALGATSVRITVFAGTAPNQDWAIWKDLRIEGSIG